MNKTLSNFLCSILLILCVSINNSYGQDFISKHIISFEDNAIKSILNTKNSKVELSNTHYKHGALSLKWDFEKQASLELNKDINFVAFDPTSTSKAIPTFCVWVYNEKAIDGKVKFQFLTDDKVNCEFELKANFTGWRAAWVAFERDMQGTPVSSMNKMRIVAPKNNTGTLFFDHIMLCAPADSRWNTPDYQLPFVNAKTKNHWLVLYKSSLNNPSKKLPALTQEHIKSFETIAERYSKQINIDRYPKGMSQITKQFKTYNITRENGKIKGKVMWFCRFSEIYRSYTKEWKNYYTNKDKGLKDYLSLMHNIAFKYNKTHSSHKKAKLEKMFFDMSDHLIDQGWAAGSGNGTLHHLGYSMRKYYSAYFLMRKPLERTGRLAEIQKAMEWFSGVREVFAPITKKGMSIDAFNTSVMGRLASILLLPASPEKVRYLNYYVAWIDNGLAYADGLYDSFKVDGAVFHHGNNYPAYASGGFDGATLMVYFFSNTSFRVSKEGHDILSRAILKTRLFCNKKTWPLSMSGRHPKGKGKLSVYHYQNMAFAGNTENGDAIDANMASVYLRLVKGEKKIPETKQLLRAGYKPESDPIGNWPMNYAALGIHRRGSWSATAQGHSRYLWAAEHYLGANYYGRYLKHGSLEIKSGKDKPDDLTSGFSPEGWDWGRIPGTTAIHLPVDKLKANILNVDQVTGYEEMLLSDQAFAGAINLEELNGAWAMQLHEHDKYNGSHRANKSIFFFDDVIVCLGSDIENINSDYDTETTLFQNHLKHLVDKIYVNTKKVNKFPYSADIKSMSTANTIRDNVGNNYYVPGKYNVKISKSIQNSKDQKKKTPNKGSFATAVISHGKAPKGAEYEYAILVQQPLKAFNAFVAEMNNKETEIYTVLQKDKNAHIVKYNKSNTTAFVFFTANKSVNIDNIISVSRPSLMMTRNTEKETILSVCDPDLHLYEGKADVVMENGKRKERSVYSRDWFYDKSKESKIRVELKGKWNLKDNEFCKIVKTENNITVLEFTCVNGLTREVILTKK